MSEYRWLTVRVEHDAHDPETHVTIEGRGPILPFTDGVDLAPGEDERVHYHAETDGTFTDESYNGPSHKASTEATPLDPADDPDERLPGTLLHNPDEAAAMDGITMAAQYASDQGWDEVADEAIDLADRLFDLAIPDDADGGTTMPDEPTGDTEGNAEDE